MDADQLERTKAIQRHTGRNFHVATRFLPERIRHATYALYAFFRVADDVVDDPDAGPAAEQRAELDRIRAAALGERDAGPVLSAFRDVKERHGIPDREVEVFLDAMERDVDPEGYETYADLEGYLRGSAVAVAYMMLAVMDPEDREAARPHARALGEAFQLTNFLRDVREDVREYGRVYLPEETLAAHDVSREAVESLDFSEGFAAAMREELDRTEALYREGVAGIRHLPPDCRFPVLFAAVLYADHHRLIRARGFDVLSGRPTLSTARRVTLLARTWWAFRREADPEAAFERASAVPTPGDDPDPAPACRVARLGRRTAARPAGLVEIVRSRLPLP